MEPIKLDSKPTGFEPIDRNTISFMHLLCYGNKERNYRQKNHYFANFYECKKGCGTQFSRYLFSARSYAVNWVYYSA